MKYKIYQLSDPRTNATRYIGITKHELANRLLGHIRHARFKDKNHCSRWIRQLLEEGLQPIIDLVTETDNFDDEIYWIDRFLTEGHDLANTTEGGVGAFVSKNRKIEKVIKPKVIKTPVIRVHSEETIRKMSEAKLGHEVSQETRDKISLSLSGRKFGPRQTHCPNGHPYEPPHLFINVRGNQECGTCRTERDRLRRMRKKGLI